MSPDQSNRLARYDWIASFQFDDTESEMGHSDTLSLRIRKESHAHGHGLSCDLVIVIVKVKLRGVKLCPVIFTMSRMSCDWPSWLGGMRKE